MFRDLFARFREPSEDHFDAYFYDIDKPSKDLLIIPDFLLDIVQFPVAGSGTSKFSYLLYKFACEAKFGIECGVFEGGSTVPLAIGLKQHAGYLISIDTDLSRAALKQKAERLVLDNVGFLQMNDLDFRCDQIKNSVDLIFIDALHTHEHVLKELFLFDQYLKKGGVFILDDIVAYCGVGLIDSDEDAGYYNWREYIEYIKTHSGKRHISEYPVLKPKPTCLQSPIYHAIETFLAHRPSYKFYKILDQCGLGIIWKQ